MTSKLASFTLIGAGRLGRTLAYRLCDLGHGCQSIISGSLASAQKVVNGMGQGEAVASVSDALPSDWIIIATQDGMIADVVSALIKCDWIRIETVVFHTSGAKGSGALARLPCYKASFHPLIAFTLDAYRDSSLFTDRYIAIEGDAEAVAALTVLVMQLRAHPLHIRSEDKALYHVAASIGANFLVVLSQLAQRCFRGSGLSEDQAHAVSVSLMQSSLDNLRNLSPQQALTGPIQRGDVATVSKHLEALQAFPEVIAVYRSLGQVAAEMTTEPSLWQGLFVQEQR